ncbi:MAG: 4Fe-4S binding protein [Syntrophaceae bacterium]|nr:4Fe-4S binding protein [Syntrophaceae bacterium]
MRRKIFFRPERCMLCQSCVLACEMESLRVSNPREIPHDKAPLQRMRLTFFQGTPWVWKCEQCVSAPCVEACVTGSLVQTEGGAGVFHQRESCVGCGSCILVCPYDALRYDEKEERVSKCNLCPEREIPPCVEACQTEALVFQEITSFVQAKRKRMISMMGESHEAT